MLASQSVRTWSGVKHDFLNVQLLKWYRLNIVTRREAYADMNFDVGTGIGQAIDVRTCITGGSEAIDIEPTCCDAFFSE